MDGHFRAFTFVDRITELQPRVRINGTYAIPPGIKAFPQSLASEAVGQLACWAAMATANFKSRPVAGLAGNVDLLSEVRPGQTLELVAEIETADEDAVAYSGSARANGIPVVQLQNCVGPMMPIEEFDDPQALRDQFALLCGAGAPSGGFAGVPSLILHHTAGETARWLRASLEVPKMGGFFNDHFPRRPVFPGTLFMHSMIQLATSLAAQISAPQNGGAWTAKAMSDAKLRTFISPGDCLELEAKLDKTSDDTMVISVEGKKGNRVVGGNRVIFSTGQQK